MSLEYLAKPPQCPLCEQFGMEDFFQSLRKQRHLNGLWTRLRAEGMSNQQITELDLSVGTGRGGQAIQQESVKVGQMVEELKPFMHATVKCSQCSCNGENKRLGCYGAMGYPISLQGEQWLMEQFQPAENGESSLLVNTIVTRKMSGKEIQSQRPAKKLFGSKNKLSLFESPKPFECKTQYAGKKITVNSNQLFTLIFSTELWPPVLQIAFLTDFGAVDQAAGVELLMKETLAHSMGSLDLFGENDAEELLGPAQELPFLWDQPSDSDEPSIRQLKKLFATLHRSFFTRCVFMVNA